MIEKEIKHLYRAKGADGRWWSGSVVEPFGNWQVTEIVYVYGFRTYIFSDNMMYPVDSKTVCEYIGAVDKNGMRLFEGDIISAHLDPLFPDEETRLVIKRHGLGFSGYNIRCKMYDELTEEFLKQFEVIGNIHDDPEDI